MWHPSAVGPSDLLWSSTEAMLLLGCSCPMIRAGSVEGLIRAHLPRMGLYWWAAFALPSPVTHQPCQDLRRAAFQPEVLFPNPPSFLLTFTDVRPASGCEGFLCPLKITSSADSRLRWSWMWSSIWQKQILICGKESMIISLKLHM